MYIESQHVWPFASLAFGVPVMRPGLQGPARWLFRLILGLIKLLLTLNS